MKKNRLKYLYIIFYFHVLDLQLDLSAVLTRKIYSTHTMMQKL